MSSILLVTSRAVPDLTPDDQLLAAALARRGCDVRPAVWDDPSVDWSCASVAVLRSTWDYHLRRAEFLAWAEMASARTRLHNPRDVIAWNSHKSYLRALEGQGISVIETAWLPAGHSADLARLLRERDWPAAVVKPAVSASAYRTTRVSAHSAAAVQRDLNELLASVDVMVQPHLSELDDGGETSLVFITGALTHAVRRRSALAHGPGDVGTPIDPTPDEIHLAERALAASDVSTAPPLYARVDMVRTARSGLVLLELELIEPALFLRHAPAAVDRFADAIVRLA